jgi:hypothetical protein
LRMKLREPDELRRYVAGILAGLAELAGDEVVRGLVWEAPEPHLLCLAEKGTRASSNSARRSESSEPQKM